MHDDKPRTNNLPTSSTISDRGLSEAARVLDDHTDIGARTQLVPVHVCRAVVERIDGEPLHCDQDTASTLTALLLRCWPDFKPAEHKAFVVALHKVFSAYPKSLGLRVVDPVNGLPSRLKFHPKVADVSEALRDEVKRRDLIRANALSHIRERERREVEAKAENEWLNNRPDAETRRMQAQALLAVKAMPIVEPQRPRAPGRAIDPAVMADLKARRERRLAEQTTEQPSETTA